MTVDRYAELLAEARRIEREYGDSREVMLHMGEMADALEAVVAELTEYRQECTWEYGVTHVNPNRPVTVTESLHEAVASKKIYDGLIAAWGEHHPSSVTSSNILRRTKGRAPGSWIPVIAHPRRGNG